MPASILVVDDNAELCRLIAMVLADAGYEVSEASDIGVALDSIERNSPQLVLLDPTMPRRPSGTPSPADFELIKEMAPALPIVVMVSRSLVPGDISARAAATIHKPFDGEQLLATVMRALAAATGAEARTSGG